MSQNQSILIASNAQLSNAVTLLVAYGIYLAPENSKEKDKFLMLALELIYYASENVKTINIKALEYAANNALVIEICEKMKNEKANDTII